MNFDYKNLCPGCFDDSSGQETCPSCGYEDKLEINIYLPPRTILAEKYLIGRVLGQGGFGITYLGWDLNLNIKLAIKEFFPQGLVSRLSGHSKIVSLAGTEARQFDSWQERFLKEAQTLAQFEYHPNIVSVRDFFKANDTAYMIMSYVEGFTLEEYLKSVGGKLSLDRALQVMMPVMDALREVHAVGIMHRDISPDNIFIDNRGRVVLLDFGAARQEISGQSKSLSIILKAGYAPEEQYRSRGQQGPWTDVYAVGATIYHLITGETAPESMERLIEDTITAPSQLGVQISSEQEEYLFKAMAVRAKDRYQTVEEFQTALLNSDQDLKEKASDPEPGTVAPLTDYTGLKEPVVKQAAKFEKEPAPGQGAGAAGKDDSFAISKKVIIYATAVILSALLLYGGVSLFGSDPETGLQEIEQAEPVEETDENSTGNGSDPESEIIIQPGTDFPVKLESNRILNDGDDYIHGFTYGYDYLWASTRTSPTRILRINPQTLDYDRLILPSGYDMAEDIIAHDGYIWAITYTVPTRIIRIDPYNLQYDVPVEFRSGELDYGGALEYANNHLWAGGVGAIARIDLSNMSYDLFSYDGIDQQIHALTSGGGYLWAAVPWNYTLLRINLDNPNSSNRITESNLYISDDMVFVNGHLFAGTENEQPYRILKVAPDLSYVDVVQLSGCYGVFSVRDEIWSTNISTPGVIARYDLDLNPTDNVLLPSEFNDPNELVFVNDNVYVTTWQSPAGILNFQIENVP